MKEDIEQKRIDIFLNQVYLFKSRTLAAKACNEGFVQINDVLVKPSTKVKIGDIINIKGLFDSKQYKILDFAKKNTKKADAKKLVEIVN